MRKLPPEPKHGTECPKTMSGYHDWIPLQVKYAELPKLAETVSACKCGAIKRARATEIIKEGFDKK